jgi:hypothetical protein
VKHKLEILLLDVTTIDVFSVRYKGDVLSITMMDEFGGTETPDIKGNVFPPDGAKFAATEPLVYNEIVAVCAVAVRLATEIIPILYTLDVAEPFANSTTAEVTPGVTCDVCPNI